jgi:prepilin-type N-terminal cleavage/methylation domain-containing protein
MKTTNCPGLNEMPMEKKMMVSRVLNQKGFTLIEIFAAISILAIAILGLVSVTVNVIKGNTFSKTMTAATTLASDKMEQLKKTSYASLASGTDTAQTIYARTWTVTQDSPALGMKTVVVTVQWTWEGVARNVAVNSLIAQ